MEKKYKIYDCKTGTYLPNTYSTIRAASCKADKLDNEYGACRYRVRQQFDAPVMTIRLESHQLPA